MKINYKKISAIATSALLTGLTLGGAMAASFPAPYSDGTASQTAVVYGASSDDLAPATSIANYLAGEVSGGSVTVTGDSVLFDKGSVDHLTLSEVVTSMYPTLDKDELSTVLADGTYLNDDNNEYEYTQDIAMAALNVTYFRDTSLGDGGNIGVDLSSGAHLMNYSLDFTNSAENSVAFGTSSGQKLENTNIEILGKTYYISDVDATTTGVKMTLLDSANTAIINEGESTTLNVGGTDYDASISIVTTGSVKLEINGEITNSLSTGQTYKLSDGSYVGVKDITVQDYAGGAKQVEFSIGTGQIVLEDGEEVTINTDEVSDFEDDNEYSFVVNAYITNSSTAIEEIVLEWKTDSDVWIVPGREIVMPGFEAVKIFMDDFVIPGEEVTTIKDGSNVVEISTTIDDGALTLPILYANDSVTGFTGIGERATHQLETSTGSSVVLNETENSYFVASWISGNSAESYAFEIDKIEDASGKNKTTLKNLVTGGSDVSISEVGKTSDYGQVTFTLSAASDNDKTATIAVSATGSGTVSLDRLYTAEGMMMKLPVVTDTDTTATDNSTTWAAGADGLLVTTVTNATDTVTYEPTTWIMNFTEEDSSNNIGSGTSFTVTLGLDAGDGTEPTAVSVTDYETESGSRVYVGYVISPLATKTTFDNPSNGLAEVEITYHGDDAYAQFYVAEAGASTSTESDSMLFKDTETGWRAMNVVLVGGSCINSATAEALGVNAGTCTEAFTDATGVGDGEYMIKSVDGFTDGKIALIVAGYNKEDTVAAASKLTNDASDIDTAVGQSYRGMKTAGGQYTFA